MNSWRPGNLRTDISGFFPPAPGSPLAFLFPPLPQKNLRCKERRICPEWCFFPSGRGASQPPSPPPFARGGGGEVQQDIPCKAYFLVRSVRLGAWKRAGLQFAGIVIGDFGSRMVAHGPLAIFSRIWVCCVKKQMLDDASIVTEAFVVFPPPFIIRLMYNFNRLTVWDSILHFFIFFGCRALNALVCVHNTLRRSQFLPIRMRYLHMQRTTGARVRGNGSLR